jgi:hypothetical protein
MQGVQLPVGLLAEAGELQGQLVRALEDHQQEVQ